MTTTPTQTIAGLMALSSARDAAKAALDAVFENDETDDDDKFHAAIRAHDDACEAETEAAVNFVRNDLPGMLAERSWRPISEAPRKDGRQILAARPDWVRPAIFEWDADFKNWWTCDPEVPKTRTAHGGPRAVQPTHWMPLPAPPSAEQKGNDDV